jgi:hypothetical protein
MSNIEMLCDKKNIYLIKKYDKNEDDIYELYFECNYNKTSNLFEMIKQNDFEKLLYELNKDIFISCNRVNKCINYKLNDIINDKNIVNLNLRVCKLNMDDNNISFTYLDNDNIVSFEYMNFTFKMIKNKISVHLSVKFETDISIASDVMMFLYKKCLYRLKKYIEL